jgi:hypothetical protein
MNIFINCVLMVGEMSRNPSHPLTTANTNAEVTVAVNKAIGNILATK